MSVKANVLEALEQADGKYISGNQLARETGVSRNMIWKIIGQLKAEGYCVEAVTNLGYRLITENSDALVLIVSEETGAISMAREGKLTRFLDMKTVEKTLLNMYLNSEPKKGSMAFIPNTIDKIRGKKNAGK